MHTRQVAVNNFQPHSLLFIAPFHAITIITHMKTTYSAHQFTHGVIKYIFYLFHCFSTSPTDPECALSGPPAPVHVCRIPKVSCAAPKK